MDTDYFPSFNTYSDGEENHSQTAEKSDVCLGRTKTGKPCRNKLVNKDGYCPFHQSKRFGHTFSQCKTKKRSLVRDGSVICKATTASGRPCRSSVVTHSGLCPIHDSQHRGRVDATSARVRKKSTAIRIKKRTEKPEEKLAAFVPNYRIDEILPSSAAVDIKKDTNTPDDAPVPLVQNCEIDEIISHNFCSADISVSHEEMPPEYPDALENGNTDPLPMLYGVEALINQYGGSGANPSQFVGEDPGNACVHVPNLAPQDCGVNEIPTFIHPVTHPMAMTEPPLSTSDLALFQPSDAGSEAPGTVVQPNVVPEIGINLYDENGFPLSFFDGDFSDTFQGD